jgi:hypothetical protein
MRDPYTIDFTARSIKWPNAHLWYVSSWITFHGRLWGNSKISSVRREDSGSNLQNSISGGG